MQSPTKFKTFRDRLHLIDTYVKIRLLENCRVFYRAASKVDFLMISTYKDVKLKCISLDSFALNTLIVYIKIKNQQKE